MKKTGEKQKFDLITASRGKRYKIIASVVLSVGLVIVIVGIILLSNVTKAVTPNSLTIANLSNLNGKSPFYSCTISNNQPFTLSAGTNGKPLSTPIQFKLDADARQIIESIPDSNYDGLFELKIKPTAVDGTTGNLTITCGSFALRLALTYVAI